MMPPELEIKAREMVIETVELGGPLWKHVTPATVELLVEAVALDLHERQQARERGDEMSPWLRNLRRVGRPSTS
jgi:hypothetical protein